VNEGTRGNEGGSPQLELHEDSVGARHTLVLTGELDMAWSPALDATLRRLCTEGSEAITLDLSKLTFMDSTGLRAVLLARELCEQYSCEFLLIPGPPQVQRLFEVTGLLERLPFDGVATEREPLSPGCD
jgi:anti-sigma B factor antagonist